MQLIEVAWWVSLVVITLYNLLVFRQREADGNSAGKKYLPGVSIVIAVKNASTSLLQHLPEFCRQDYANFEIIIIDDHSDPEEKDKLVDGVKGLNAVRLLHAEMSAGKKHALTLGVQKARHEYILCTDADCYPASSGWISEMVKKSGEETMVLGYSPYEKKPGALNRLVRFETAMTGIQYLSWAMIGKPYMGVGRNMLYPRALFLKTEPYKGHRIPYGDDDLWVQKAATLTEVRTCFNKASHVYSIPETTLGSWLRQKHRHLSAGHHYGKKAWLQPAGYGVGLIVHWLLFAALLMDGMSSLMLVFFVTGLCVRWLIYGRWTKELGDGDTTGWFPVLELLYAIYLAGMGLWSLVHKKKTWT